MNVKDIQVGIVGMGTVGQAMQSLLILKGMTPKTYDVIPDKCLNSLETTVASDIVFVCLPTPQVINDQGLNPIILTNFFRHIATYLGNYQVRDNTIFVIKSTVPIGFTRRIKEEFGIKYLFHSPEFLSERTAKEDILNPIVAYLGTPDGTVDCQEDKVKLIHGLYKFLWPGIPILFPASETTEAIKIFSNSLYALKVTAMNELHAVCKEKGLQWHQIVAGMIEQGMIAPTHCQVPGPDGKFGFGGKCLPKDLSELCAYTKDMMPYVPSLFTSAYALNENYYRRLKTDEGQQPKQT